MLIASRHQTRIQQNKEINVCFNEVAIEQIKNVKYLCVTIYENLPWNERISGYVRIF